MRTTLTLDPDVAAKAKKSASLLGKPADKGSVAARDDSDQPVSVSVRPLPDGRLQLPTGAGIAAYVIE